MSWRLAKLLLSTLIAWGFFFHGANGAIPPDLQAQLNTINKAGPYLGLVIPNSFEMNPLLSHPSYSPSTTFQPLDFAGRRFRFGTLEGKKVILVMTGLAMVNAGITTQMLLDLFEIEGVVHYGIAGNADPSYHIGDVTIPRYWAHTALWNWQRYGAGPDDELPLEEFGDYTREIGYIGIGDYTVEATDEKSIEENGSSNLLNNIWYQPEEVFPVDGVPEQRRHVFWIPVDRFYRRIASQLEGLELERCVNESLCLDYAPKVARVSKGGSASIYVDNAAYRNFLFDKFGITPIEMESAAVALICYQQKKPFIVIRALSDLAGGGSAESNEANLFTPVAATNSITVVVNFVKILATSPRGGSQFQI